jgi:carbamoyltransferase
MDIGLIQDVFHHAWDKFLEFNLLARQARDGDIWKSMVDPLPGCTHGCVWQNAVSHGYGNEESNLTAILGIHLGHDASVSVVKNGILLTTVLQERLTRIRHDYGLEPGTIDLALLEASLSWSDIDEVAVTATQLMPAVIRGEFEELVIQDLAWSLSNRRDSSYQGRDWVSPKDEKKTLLISGSRFDATNDTINTVNLLTNRGVPPRLLTNMQWHLLNDSLSGPRSLRRPVAIREVLERVKRYLASMPHDFSPSKQFQDIEVLFRGERKPGKFWAHHAAHAASNVMFDHTPRPIISHDGGLGIQSGAVWDWTGKSLNMVTPHFLELGALYDYFGVHLGLGTLGPAGKLMGLAAYGPNDGAGRLPIPKGNIADWAMYLAQKTKNLSDGHSLHKTIWDLSVSKLKSLDLKLEAIGDPELVTEPAPSSLARMMQDYVERTFGEFASEVAMAFGRTSIGISGGFALNCPTNSSLYNLLEGSTNIVIEPHCEDGGCSVGSATLSHLESTGTLPMSASNPSASSSYAFAGPSDKVFRTSLAPEKLEALGLDSTECDDIGSEIAKLILDDKVVAIFSGPSEVGPRALGHRSILANPARKENWLRVNQIKRRENWRPFAPAVLEVELGRYFDGGPNSSPFMLFNYRVRPEFLAQLGAITHVDGTSRVQTVDSHSQPLHTILLALKKLGLPPVVLNTSLNGPGEPIVQKAEEALRLLIDSEIDVLAIESTLIWRKK